MKESTSFAPELAPVQAEIHSDLLPYFATKEQANEAGYTESVALSDQLDGNEDAQSRTEIQRLYDEHNGDIALVRREDAPAYIEVFAKLPEQVEEVKVSHLRGLGKAAGRLLGLSK